jgi:hypothetical protein
MPHTTAKYRFEWQVAAWASALAQACTGRKAPFVLIVASAGDMTEVRFDPADPVALLRELERSGTPHLFYDPFDAPEYSYLAWSQIPQETMRGSWANPWTR